MADTSPPLLSAPALDDIRAQLDPTATAVTRTTLSLSLATPMFGGGVKAGEVDLSQPFRPSAIRGQLRFWWRATAGARYSTADKLFEAEARLWGDTRQASRVRLHVHSVKAEEKNTDKGWRLVGDAPRRMEPAYVHFLIPDKTMNAEHAGTLVAPRRRLLTGSFDLDIEMVGLEEPQKREVATAIRAWILFGGIGARTRRGCGTLYPAKLTGFDPIDLEASIRKFFGNLPLADCPWPTLKGAALFIGAPDEITGAWHQLIRTYAEFRQQRTPPRPGDRHPGRSYWPEPEAIRNLTGQRSARHARLGTDPNDFPRALLGLPVVTHFKDERQGDPRDTTLEATVSIRRHASPLILKVIPVGPKRGVPIALLLNTDIVNRLKDNLELKSSNQSWTGLSTGNAKSPLDIRAGRRANRKGSKGEPMTLREWLKASPLQLKEVTL